MSWLRCLALVALGACGDNMLPDGAPLVPGADLVVVAHQDDDLLFMQPDLLEAVQRGDGITTVYVTAGNGDKGADKAERRYEGLRHAYGAAAGSMDWQCGWLALVGHIAQHCRLADKPVSLVFLAYPDGGREGQFDTSLIKLWQGAIASAETIANRTTRYDRDQLIEVVAQIVRETEPRTVRTLEIAATHGRDHSDHMLAGALALLAVARANSTADLISYRAYNVTSEPPNQDPAMFDAALAMLAPYEACATSCGECGEPCTSIGDTHLEWLDRRYAIGFRPVAAGRLRSGTQCLTEQLQLAECTSAPSWQLDSYGQLRTASGHCLLVSPTGELALDACIGGPERRFFLDDEGHVWSGMPPTPDGIALYTHLWCLTPSDAGVRMAACGADAAPTWQLVPRTASTPRADLGFAATGREVRLGDVDGDGRADLCAISNGLYCALGDGTGGFATPATRIDSAAAPLAIEPRSLTFGDVDGDQRSDACGRDASGLLCATAASGFAAMRWSPLFDDTVARAGTSASLAAVDADADGIADVCGVDATGIVCAPRGPASAALVRSAWPDPASVVWLGDLDGDRQADWCAATDAGPACGAYAQRERTTDGVPWGYSQLGEIDIAPANAATTALADIDGDGRADLCTTSQDRVVCARSQGRGFGPRTVTLALLPNQSAASALWLGDLDGDGRADACADAGASIICAVEP